MDKNNKSFLLNSQFYNENPISFPIISSIFIFNEI